MNGRLYLVATPIGNLEDITLRAIRVLKEVDIVVAEDTRQTVKLLNHLQIQKNMISYHRHSTDERCKQIIKELKDGKDIALVSDAGTPAISDPGEEVVKLAISEGIKVIPIPGACALINGLIASGIDTKEFSFFGFLPMDKKLRKYKLEEIEKSKVTVVLYEAPHKLKNTLKDLSTVTDMRRIVLARELTKIYEEFLSGTAEELLEKVQEPRGEFVIIIEKNDNIDTNIFDNMTLDEHYKYYEKLRIYKKGYNKTDCKRSKSKKE